MKLQTNLPSDMQIFSLKLHKMSLWQWHKHSKMFNKWFIRGVFTSELCEQRVPSWCIDYDLWSKTLCNRKTNNVSKILPVEFRRNKNINFFGFGNESLPNDIYYSFFVTSFYIYVCKLECSVVFLINVPSRWFSFVLWTTLKPEV